MPYKTSDTGKILWQDEERVFIFFSECPYQFFFSFGTFVFLGAVIPSWNTIMGYLISHFIFVESNDYFNSHLFLWQHLNKFFTFVNIYQTSAELNLKIFIHFIYLIFWCKMPHYILNSKFLKVPWRVVFLC